MSISLTICVLCLLSLQSKSQPDPSTGQSAITQVGQVLDLLKSLKTDRSSTIQSVQENSGFLELSGVLDHSSGTVLDAARLPRLLEFWLHDPIFQTLPRSLLHVVQRSFEELLLVGTPEYKKQQFQMSYQSGFGDMVMLDLVLTVPPNGTRNASAIVFQKLIIGAKFRPAPKFLIVRNSDCNLLSCETQDQIVYLDPVLTDAHLATVANMFVQMVRVCQDLLAT